MGEHELFRLGTTHSCTIHRQYIPICLARVRLIDIHKYPVNLPFVVATPRVMLCSSVGRLIPRVDLSETLGNRKRGTVHAQHHPGTSPEYCYLMHAYSSLGTQGKAL